MRQELSESAHYLKATENKNNKSSWKKRQEEEEEEETKTKQDKKKKKQKQKTTETSRWGTQKTGPSNPKKDSAAGTTDAAALTRPWHYWRWRCRVAAPDDQHQQVLARYACPTPSTTPTPLSARADPSPAGTTHGLQVTAHLSTHRLLFQAASAGRYGKG